MAGDCFEVAFDLMRAYIEDVDVELRLVHAAIVGQGPIEGVVHAHAWVERVVPVPVGTSVTGETVDTVFCIDRSNGKNLFLPRATYYNIARVHEDKTFYSLGSSHSCVQPGDGSNTNEVEPWH